MNKNIMAAVEKIEEVVDAVPFFEYNQKIPKERAIADRKKMLAILREFYCSQNLNDFVTLFAVYCNHYIRYNLHQCLEDEDFGISALWNVITDGNLRRYLSLIREGISERKVGCFQQAVAICSGYSLPYLYLFLDVAEEFFGNNQKEKEETIVSLYDNMDSELQKYVLGKSEFITIGENPAVDENPLPYLCLVSYSEDVVRAMMPHYAKFKNILGLDEGNPSFINFIESISRFMKESISDAKRQEMADLDLHWQIIFEKLEGLLDNQIGTKLERLKASLEEEEFEALLEEWGIEQEEEEDAEEEPERLKDGSLAERLVYLNIPTQILSTTRESSGNLFDSLVSQTKLKAERDIAIKQKNAIVSEFSHTYSNMKATSLYEMAQTLLNNDNVEYKNMGRRLLLEYGIKQSLTKDVYMLKLKFEQQAEKLQRLLKDSKADFTEEHDTIFNIMNAALVLCLLRVFYDSGDQGAKLIRTQLKKHCASLNALRDYFEQQVIFAGNDCLALLQDKGFIFAVQCSEAWQSICLQKESYAAIFLRSIFAELFINLLKYADTTKPIKINLSVNPQMTEYLRLEVINAVKQDVESLSGVGLIAKNEMLKLINLGEVEGKLSVANFVQADENEQGEFITSIDLRADLFVYLPVVPQS